MANIPTPTISPYFLERTADSRLLLREAHTDEEKTRRLCIIHTPNNKLYCPSPYHDNANKTFESAQRKLCASSGPRVPDDFIAYSHLLGDDATSITRRTLRRCIATMNQSIEALIAKQDAYPRSFFIHEKPIVHLMPYKDLLQVSRWPCPSCHQTNLKRVSGPTLQFRCNSCGESFNPLLNKSLMPLLQETIMNDGLCAGEPQPIDVCFEGQNIRFLSLRLDHQRVQVQVDDNSFKESRGMEEVITLPATLTVRDVLNCLHVPPQLLGNTHLGLPRQVHAMLGLTNEETQGYFWPDLYRGGISPPVRLSEKYPLPRSIQNTISALDQYKQNRAQCVVAIKGFWFDKYIVLGANSDGKTEIIQKGVHVGVHAVLEFIFNLIILSLRRWMDLVTRPADSLSDAERESLWIVPRFAVSQTLVGTKHILVTRLCSSVEVWLQEVLPFLVKVFRQSAEAREISPGFLKDPHVLSLPKQTYNLIETVISARYILDAYIMLKATCEARRASDLTT